MTFNYYAGVAYDKMISEKTESLHAALKTVMRCDVCCNERPENSFVPRHGFVVRIFPPPLLPFCATILKRKEQKIRNKNENKKKTNEKCFRN